MIHQRHRRTDRQTDGRTDDMRLQDLALHYNASRGKNEVTERNEKVLEFFCGKTAVNI